METIPVFGTYAPGPATRLAIKMARTTPLGRGSLRRKMAGLVHKMNAGQPLDISLYGGRARLHATGNVSETKALLNPAQYGREEYEFCRQHMPRHGGTFLDIGANAGVFTLFIASLMDNGRIISAEPQPHIFERLRTNLALNPQHAERLDIHMLDVAIGGEESGALRLSTPASAGQASARFTEGSPTIEVPVVPMLNVLQESGTEQLDLLKLDVEGFEDGVLFPFFSQAPESLWPQAIVMEHSHSERWQHNCETMLLDCGYSILRKTSTDMMLTRSSDPGPDPEQAA